MVFSPTTFTFILLPPIIFHTGVSLDLRTFLHEFGTITLYAVVGTIVSTIVMALILNQMFRYIYNPHHPQSSIHTTHNPQSTPPTILILTPTHPYYSSWLTMSDALMFAALMSAGRR
jgi:hypothetical protein